MACANVPGDRGPVQGGFIAGRAYGGIRNHMDHLTATEKQITWAAVAVVFLSIYSLANAWGSLMFVPLLAGLAALVILFLPRISPNTKAPGSKGSLLMVSGVLAAAFWLLAVLTWVGWIFDHLGALWICFPRGGAGCEGSTIGRPRSRASMATGTWRHRCSRPPISSLGRPARPATS